MYASAQSYKSAFLNLFKKNNTEEVRSHLLDRANCATNLKTHIDNKLNSEKVSNHVNTFTKLFQKFVKSTKILLLFQKLVADVVELQWTTEKNRILNSIKESGVKPETF